jgi:hypothetical protein
MCEYRLTRKQVSASTRLTCHFRELSSLGDTSIEISLQKCFHQVGVQADDLSRALVTKLDTQQQDMIALHNDHQKALTLKLDHNHQSTLSLQDKHSNTLSLIQCTQTDVLRRQDASIRVATHTQEQTSRIVRTMERHNSWVVDVSNKTTASLSDLAADIKQLVSLNDGSLLVDQSCREISFLGECQDRILAYLLPFQDDLELAIDYLISQHGHEISTSAAEFLRYELQHLVDSAAQEKALRHPNSTAKSFDQWFYPEDTVGFLKIMPGSRKSRSSLCSPDSHGKPLMKRIEQQRNRKKQFGRTYTVQTRSGPVTISMPRSRGAGIDLHDTAEVGISYAVTQNGSSIHVSAHFLRHLAYAGEARICAQLNVFTLIGKDVWDYYEDLFDKASLAEIDSALRRCTISPFHIDVDGDNVCLYVSYDSIFPSYDKRVTQS